MISVEELRNAGADVESGLSRCLGNEALYIMLVNMGLGDKKFEELGRALSEKNLDQAFEFCHALKGVIGNLSITPLYEALSKMTEKLRKRETADYQSMYTHIIEIRSKLSGI